VIQVGFNIVLDIGLKVISGVIVPASHWGKRGSSYPVTSLVLAKPNITITK